MKKIQVLSFILLIGAGYYLIGAVAHFFCLTWSPWYDGALCSPYHDSLIAVASLAVSGFFYVTSLEPKKMALNLWVIIVAGLVVAFLTFFHAVGFDFTSKFGSDLKAWQAVNEGTLLLILAVLILYLKPKAPKRRKIKED